jgi:16S rRNA C967 or C1407 C5-methylase (RsmB/RsmF family)
MVLSALLALKPDGKLLYCTCALSPLENDGVVERVLKKEEGEVKLLPMELEDPEVVVEPTRFGVQILADLSRGAGPLYLALLSKRICPKKSEGTGPGAIQKDVGPFI